MIYLFLFVAAVAVGAAIKVTSAGGGIAGNARIRGYKVVVDGDQVKSAGQMLGPLAGARAELADGTSRHTLTHVANVTGALTRKMRVVVIVTCANGEYRESTVEGPAAVRKAQAWVDRFNAIAAASMSSADAAVGPAAAPRPGGSSVRASVLRGLGPEYASWQERLRKWRAAHPRQDPRDD